MNAFGSAINFLKSFQGSFDFTPKRVITAQATKMQLAGGDANDLSSTISFLLRPSTRFCSLDYFFSCTIGGYLTGTGFDSTLTGFYGSVPYFIWAYFSIASTQAHIT